MDKNIYVLDMPDFKPVYSQNVQYGYYGKRGDRLKVECVPNMSIVCSNCNQSLKRVGEKSVKRK